jgi:ribosomal protein S18 acetylase RimI-like enzyme
MSGTDLQRTETGAEARRDGAVVAAVSGDLRADGSAWIEARGDVALLPDLYALAAAPWVDGGHLAHNVVVAADDRAVIETWFGLCFGRQQVHAELDLHASDFSSQGAEGVAIRPGTVEDAVALGDLIYALQAEAPVWSGFEPRGPDELRAGWSEALADPDAHYLVAELEGRPAGYVLLWRGTGGVAELSVAATLPELRGRGVGSALTAAAVGWARAEGFHTLEADWRSTNLLASRFWPRRGFRQAFLRLYRSIP